jgi:hypothetical protein
MRNLTQLVGAGRWLHLRARGHKLVHVLVAATALSIVVDATAVAAPLPQLPKSLIIKPIATTDAPGIPEAGDATARLAKEQPAAGGITTFGDASGAFRCSPTWNYIAAKANSFVTGNCYGATSGAWYMQRTKKQFDSTHQIYWDGGYVNGSYDGCGWMRQQDSTLSNTAVNTVCASPDKAYCDYIVCVDGKPWTFGGTTMGSRRTSSRLAGSTPTTALGSLTASRSTHSSATSSPTRRGRGVIGCGRATLRSIRGTTTAPPYIS